MTVPSGFHRSTWLKWGKKETEIQLILIYLCLVVPCFAWLTVGLSLYRWVHGEGAPLPWHTQEGGGAGMCNTQAGLIVYERGRYELSTLIHLFTMWGGDFAWCISLILSLNISHIWLIIKVGICLCRILVLKRKSHRLWYDSQIGRRVDVFRPVIKPCSKLCWQHACVSGSAGRMQDLCRLNTSVKATTLHPFILVLHAACCQTPTDSLVSQLIIKLSQCVIEYLLNPGCTTQIWPGRTSVIQV